MGRVTSNPLKHVDLIGTSILLVLLITDGSMMCGFAKPGPINFARPARYIAGGGGGTGQKRDLGRDRGVPSARVILVEVDL